MCGVVMLIRNVASEKYGGGESYQLMLARELKKSGMTPVIVTSSRKLLFAAQAEGFEGVKAPFCRRQNWSGIANLLLPIYYIWQWRLKRWYKKLFLKYRPEVVNVQSRDDWIAASLAAKKMGVRVFWTDHMDFRSWALWNVDKPLKNLIGKWILRVAKQADKIIMISDFEREWFEERVKPRKYENLVTIKNGVKDYMGDFEQIKTKNGSFCYVGRIEDYKGVRDLVRAFLRLAEEHPKATLNIYGEGADLEGCKGLAKGCERVKFWGFTEEPLKAMAENEVFVLPSYREGLSLSLIDAMMMGKEIIASKVDGNPELVTDGETGILVKAGDVRGLAAAMKKMLDEPQKAREMARAAREKYEEEYDFDKIFEEKMVKLYKVCGEGELVSVVIPVWNVEKYVEKCLESAVGQSYRELEILVVDDGSLDRSGEICDEFARRDERVKVFHRKNGGLSEARNYGISKAKGDWIVLLDGDDYLERDFVKEMMGAVGETGTDIAVCGYNDTTPKEEVLTGAEATAKLLTRQENMEIVAWNKIYRKGLFGKIKYPVGEKHEDTLTTYKLLAGAGEVAYVGKSLYHYVARGESITGSEKIEERLKARERAAGEAVEYFSGEPELKKAAEVAVLLSKYAYMDAAIRGEVDGKLYKENRAWVMKNRGKFRGNPYLTGKLRFYNFINFVKLYKVFRTII